MSSKNILDAMLQQLSNIPFPDHGEQSEQVEIYRQAIDRGYQHGKNGWYPDCDYSSDADWCYGTGAWINKIEEQWQDDCGSVFEAYCAGHQAGLESYEENNNYQS